MHLIRVHQSACVCVRVGIYALRHVCSQHGAMAGPVLASWSLNLLRGSAAQWREVGRIRIETQSICPGLPLWPGRAAWQAQPGTDSSAQPKTQRRRWKVRHAGEKWWDGEAVETLEAGETVHTGQQKQQQSEEQEPSQSQESRLSSPGDRRKEIHKNKEETFNFCVYNAFSSSRHDELN